MAMSRIGSAISSSNSKASNSVRCRRVSGLFKESRELTVRYFQALHLTLISGNHPPLVILKSGNPITGLGENRLPKNLLPRSVGVRFYVIKNTY